MLYVFLFVDICKYKLFEFFYRFFYGVVLEGVIDGSRGDEGRLNKGRGFSNRRGGDFYIGDF